MFKIVLWTGTLLLLLMAIFHGSGFAFVMDKMNQSNASPFLKEIMPVLFLLPSVHLVCLASLGGISIFLGDRSRPVLVLVIIFSGINMVFALYLGAYIPSILLLLAIGCFLLAIRYVKSRREEK